MLIRSCDIKFYVAIENDEHSIRFYNIERFIIQNIKCWITVSNKCFCIIVQILK